jgi:hypothetical protein
VRIRGKVQNPEGNTWIEVEAEVSTDARDEEQKDALREKAAQLLPGTRKGRVKFLPSPEGR